MLKTGKRNAFGILLMIAIAVLALVLFKLIASGAFDGLRLNLDNDWQDLKTQFEIVRDNTKDLVAPGRKPPYSTLLAEAKLAQLLPGTFAEFQEEDWKDFWNLIYGVHERDDYGLNYKPKRKRQLSIDEIEEILKFDYPHVFARFNHKMWQDFWKVIFEKQ